MFDSANLAHRIDKATYKKEEPKLRNALLQAQLELTQQKRFPVLILIAGAEGAGKSETVNLLAEWMDARYIQTSAFSDPSDEERERPHMWRYWRALPPKGRVGIFLGAWHTQPVMQRAFKKIGEPEFDQFIEEAKHFEQMLADEGVLLLKFWFHLTKEQQRVRLRSLEKDPKTRWRVTDVDWKFYKRHAEFERVGEHYTRATSTGQSPWIVVAGADARYRSLTVGKALLAAMRERLDEKNPGKGPDRSPPLLPSVDKQNVITTLKLDRPMTKAKFATELEKWQGHLNLLSRHKKFANRSVVCVFEGNDAAGKGGAIRRVTGALDARRYRGVPVAAPTEEERAQPYLWRFWRHLPGHGYFSIFDRSWYGRVLVERVEGYCAHADWMRAYGEINDFEEQMVRHGTIVAKFWLTISKEEQFKRFKAREAVSFKQFKITAEDWRNRKKWDAYELAVSDMVDRTSSSLAPWTLVEANNKYYARIKILKTLCKSIEGAL